MRPDRERELPQWGRESSQRKTKLESFFTDYSSLKLYGFQQTYDNRRESGGPQDASNIASSSSPIFLIHYERGL